MFTAIEEFGLWSSELTPIVQTLDESDITILEFKDLLEFDWDLFNVEEEVEAHHVSLIWPKVVVLHLDGILYFEFLNFNIILVEDEAGEVDDWLKFEFLIGKNIQSEFVAIVLDHVLRPFPTGLPLEFVANADFILVSLVGTALAVRVVCHDSWRLSVVFLLDKVTLSGEACTDEEGSNRK